eukprot:9279581-Pyramimonas_sp.AAC.1
MFPQFLTFRVSPIDASRIASFLEPPLEAILSHARLEPVGGYIEPCSAILGHLEAALRPRG